MTCKCHSDMLYASLRDCPKCGHRSFDALTTWGGCERKRCGYETKDQAVLARLGGGTPAAARRSVTPRM
jgi:hypothetical protein